MTRSKTVLPPSTYLSVAGLALFFLLLPMTLTADEPDRARTSVDTLPVSRVEEGMTGYGKTVFENQTIDTFGVTVLGTLRDAMPDQDMILIRAEHPILESTQVMSGMSGSPIYVNGKLIGALAYSWGFAKEPIAGVTPIENIFQANRRYESSGGSNKGEQLRSLLTTNGFHGRFQSAIEEKFEELGFPVKTVATGSSGSTETEPNGPPFEPGDAVGAQLMRGDLSMTAVGTVTHVDDGEVYAFGHPFMNSGRIEFPMTTATVHTPMPSLQSSFKISSPGRTVGAVTQDRQAAVVGETGNEPEMLPVTLNLRTSDGSFEKSYGVDVVRNRYLTPQLVSTAASNFASEKINQLGLNRVESRIHVELENSEDIVLRESSVISGGFDPWAFLPLTSVWNNPFRSVDVEDVTIDMTMKPELEAAMIEDVWLGSNTLKAGETTTVFARIKPYRDESITLKTEFTVPSTVRGDRAKLHVVPGSALQGLQAEPESFDQLVSYLNTGRLDSELGVLLQIPELNLKASGHHLDRLPYSISGAFQRSTETTADFDAADLTSVLETDWVLEGNQSVNLRIQN